MNPTILIVDDEKNTREGLRRSLEDDFDVYVAGDIQGALNVIESDRIDLMLTDLRLGGEDGMVLVERALKRPHPPICIMMTAYGSVDLAVEAMKRGAYDFVTKPINIDRLDILIKRALRGNAMEKENRELKQVVDKRFGLEKIVGESAVMQEIFATIRQVAPTRATVLIQGESGTGKELVARAIHQLSNRTKNKFVAVHCAALPGPLLESELFGHERGAFTGAMERRIGRFEEANGGTIFLDEIGEIDQGTQVKLLRVLGERSFERLGSNQPIQVDVRLVAATNKDLEALTEEGKFRDDLFFRLNVVQIDLPPLRQRKEDIVLLVHEFLKSLSKKNEKPYREMTSDALSALMDHDWPGNVRELQTAVEHGVVMASGPKITLRDLPHSVRFPRARTGRAMSRLGRSGKNEAPFNLEARERDLIIQALRECHDNRTHTAKKLGISRRTLHRKLREYRIEHQDG